MKRLTRLFQLLLAGALASSVVGYPSARAAATARGIDAAFAAFWKAPNPAAAAKAVPEIVASGVTFEEAVKRFGQGRHYSANVPKGVVKGSYQANGKEFFYAVNIPESYDPARRYQVRFQLHGGVSRPTNGPRGDGTIGALAGAEQIYILPSAWNDAPWWTSTQIENLHVILDIVKRTYNVDENRVAISGVSDGGTAVFYLAMRDTTPYASFLPLNGSIMILDMVRREDVFPNNLRNKPLFIVNGGLDPLYPLAFVEPYVRQMMKRGVEIDFEPQPNGVHNTAWWPEVKDSFETFVRTHPRRPLADTLTWESSARPADNRDGWLIIDSLVPRQPDDHTPQDTSDSPLPDVNRFDEKGRVMFDNRRPSGRVDLVRTGNTVKATTRNVATFTLLLSPDLFDLSRPVVVETNGTVAFSGMVEKSVATLAKWAAKDNDRTMLFGAELQVTVR